MEQVVPPDTHKLRHDDGDDLLGWRFPVISKYIRSAPSSR
jgi:hypothetical protein